MRLLCLALVLGAPGLTAQNHVKNGGFTAGLVGWTTSGSATTPRVESFDTTGLGASAALGATPLVKPGSRPFTLAQKVPLGRGVSYELTMDIAAFAASGTTTAAAVEVKIGATILQSLWIRRVPAKATVRNRICARFTATTAGLNTLTITLRPKLMSLTQALARSYFDNVAIVRNFDPVFCIRGDRKLGAQITAEVMGKAGAAFVVLVSPKALAVPVAVPGFTGMLQIDLASSLFLYSGALGTSGKTTQKVTLPTQANLHAVPLWFQGIQIAAPASFSLGPAHNMGLHK